VAVAAEGETSAAEGSDESAEAAPAPSLPAAIGTTVELNSTTTFTAATRIEASQLLSSVESFFRQVEPSSPIPTLLIRARSYFGKDFSSILNEMMPPEPVASSE
jgi:predicted component of type VI protein secretion system